MDDNTTALTQLGRLKYEKEVLVATKDKAKVNSKAKVTTLMKNKADLNNLYTKVKAE